MLATLTASRESNEFHISFLLSVCINDTLDMRNQQKSVIQRSIQDSFKTIFNMIEIIFGKTPYPEKVGAYLVHLALVVPVSESLIVFRAFAYWRIHCNTNQ